MKKEKRRASSSCVAPPSPSAPAPSGPACAALRRPAARLADRDSARPFRRFVEPALLLSSKPFPKPIPLSVRSRATLPARRPLPSRAGQPLQLDELACSQFETARSLRGSAGQSRISGPGRLCAGLPSSVPARWARPLPRSLKQHRPERRPTRLRRTLSTPSWRSGRSLGTRETEPPQVSQSASANRADEKEQPSPACRQARPSHLRKRSGAVSRALWLTPAPRGFILEDPPPLVEGRIWSSFTKDPPPRFSATAVLLSSVECLSCTVLAARRRRALFSSLLCCKASSRQDDSCG